MPTYNPPPSHTRRIQSKETKNSTLECKKNESNAKKCGSEECKQKQKSSHTGKIIKQKTLAKVLASREGFERGDPIKR